MKWISLATLGLLSAAAMDGLAQPCSMFNRRAETLSRDGDQAMYAYFRKGWQSIVVYPAFKGDAKDFALCMMLPSVPEFRMEKAELFNELRQHTAERSERGFNSAQSAKGGPRGNDPEPEVVVVKTEVSGAYKSVTLKATAVKALTDWLDENQYQYGPAALAAFEEYSKVGWFFVAVKIIREDQAKGFDGRLRPMGMRFETPEPVIWTRLTALNPNGMTMNLYLITDSPMFIGEFPSTWQNSLPVMGRWQGKGNADFPVTRVFTGQVSRPEILKHKHLIRVLDEDVWMDAGPEKRDEMKRLREVSEERFAELTSPLYKGLWLTRFMGYAPSETLANKIHFTAEKAWDKLSAATQMSVLKRNASNAAGRRKALDAIRASAEHADVAAISAELGGSDDGVRRAVAEALGFLSAKAAVPALIDAMEKEEDFFARAAMRDALTAITGESHRMTEAAKYREWWNRNK